MARHFDPVDIRPRTIPIMNIPIADLDMKGMIAGLDFYFRGDRSRREGRFICFRDVHGVVRAQDSSEQMDAHQKAMMVVADGMPLVWVSRWRGALAIDRIAGMDALPEVCEAGLKQGWRHVFMGGAPGVAEKLADNLTRRYPGLIVAGTECPPFRIMAEEETDAMIARIVEMKPHCLWVGLGAPRQELWMAQHAHKMKGIVSFGVGAAFDIHAGLIRRSPRFIQRMGMEWAFRILMEPRRLWRRYFETLPRFIAGVMNEEMGFRPASRGLEGVTLPLTAIPSLGRTTAQMTPPSSLVDATKRFALRKVHDRLAPIAYRRQSAGIRPLTFHYLFDQDRDNADAIFSALKQEGDFIDTRTMLAMLESGKPIRDRLFHLSIDDGFENIVTNADPILKSHRIPYALMICPDFVGTDMDGLARFAAHARYARILPMASWADLRRLAGEGVEIGAHTMTHRRVSELSCDALHREIVEPRKVIEREIGQDCISFAWPFGQLNAMSGEALDLCREAGYRAVFSSVRGTVKGGYGVPDVIPRHHFEPDWPVDTVRYYATRREAAFPARISLMNT